MRDRVKDIFAQFDEVCRLIFKAAEVEAKSHPLAPEPAFKPDAPHTTFQPHSLQPTFQPDVDAGDSPDENTYASHVARGMAKIRAGAG
jgi:hypothetical protein